jgi:hypothetical protein
MRRILFAAASVLPLVFFAGGATAQIDAASGARIGGGGGGGVVGRGGGYGGGMRQPGMAPRAFGGGGYRGGVRPGAGPGWRGGVVRPGVGYGWRGRGAYPGRAYGYGRRGYYPYAGAAAGLALGAGALYPYYNEGYDYPVYESYPVPVPVPVGGLGRYCETPVKTCQLINVAQVGGGCSCKVTGGRSRGTVVP